jgi:2-keto-4-pentenoate hydratase/2-oxohepta-3-ene-1,7-dioic acid hydratase in catechol pathway
MTKWVRFDINGAEGFGTVEGQKIHVHKGDMFSGAEGTGEVHSLNEVRLLTPCKPSKMLGMWRNFHALGAAMHMESPVDPLYFIKATSSFLEPGGIIRKPAQFDGTIVFEGELGIVIGKKATAIEESEALSHIFGYTCVNDVTGMEPLQDKVFPHWTRAKGFDTFGPFGPCIETEFNWHAASLRTVLGGTKRQDYPFSDMVMSPATLVSRISFDMTLMPGDVIACGTSTGVGKLKPDVDVSVEIDGIGVLTNIYRPRGDVAGTNAF